MNRIRRNIIIITSLIISSLLLFPSLHTQEEEKKKEKKDDRYVQEEASFEIDVNYRVLDVMAFDENGRHVLDLEKDDFVLKVGKKEIPISSLNVFNYMNDGYINRLSKRDSSSTLLESVKDKVIDENGFERSSAEVEAQLALKKQPPRTFVIIFANLPYLPKRWFNLRDGLLEYIDNYMGDNVQIAVYSMGMSDFALLQPFTSDKMKVRRIVDKYLSARWGEARRNEGNYDDGIERIYDLDDDPDELLIMADAPDLEIDHSNSSWLISGFDDISISKSTLYHVFKQFDMLVNRLREIPGRKNILLFSEGLPYVPSSVQEYIRVRNRKRSIVSRMMRYNISLYVFDLFTTRNLSAAGRRQGFLAEFSADTGGGLFPFLGNNPVRLKERLVSMDVHSACYYLVGFYVNDLDIDESTPIDLEVTRKDVTLYYNKWTHGKAIYSGGERYLNEMEASRKMFDSEAHNELNMEAQISFLPGNNNKTWINIGASVNLRELIMPPGYEDIKETDADSSDTGQEEEEDDEKKTLEDLIQIPDDLDVNIGIELKNRKTEAALLAIKEIDYEYNSVDKSINYNYRALMKPGVYSLKLMFHSKHNNKTATKNYKITIPDFGFDEELHSLFILGAELPDRVFFENELPFYRLETPEKMRTFLSPQTGVEFATTPTIPIPQMEALEFMVIYHKSNPNPPAVRIIDESGAVMTSLDPELFSGEKNNISTNYIALKSSVPVSNLKPGKYELVSMFTEKGRKNQVPFIIE